VNRGRSRLEIGCYGDINVSRRRAGSYRAETRYRDWDGEVRKVTATGTSASAAKSALRHKLAQRGADSGHGQALNAESPVSALAAAWLEDHVKDGMRLTLSWGRTLQAMVNAVQVDTDGLARLDDAYTSFTGRTDHAPDVLREKKAEALKTLFRGEVGRLARRLVGLKGYVSNIPIDLMPPGEVITSYHNLWQVEGSRRSGERSGVLPSCPIWLRSTGPCFSDLGVCAGEGKRVDTYSATRTPFGRGRRPFARATLVRSSRRRAWVMTWRSRLVSVAAGSGGRAASASRVGNRSAVWATNMAATTSR
jgi:hypothetical protein